MKLKLPYSKKLSFSFKKWGIGVAAIALSMTISLSTTADSAYCATSNAKPKTNLDKLEMKYFRHMYPENDTNARLKRLEKMVFGEEKTGSDSERLSNIMATVPDLGEEEEPAPAKNTAKSADDEPSSSTAQAPAAADDGAEDGGGDVGEYPAVTAIEKHVFNGKDFASEPVGARLARLEKKVFGKPSASDDLSERVDALKASTRVDVTKKAPAGSEWADEEDPDDTNFPEPNEPIARGYPGVARPGEDGRSFSGRDLRKDFEKAGLRRNAAGGYSAGSGSYGSGSSGVARGGGGSYGMSGGSSGSGSYGSGSYGMGGGSDLGDSGSYGSTGMSGGGSMSGGGFSGTGSRGPRVAAAPRTAPSYKSTGNYADPDPAGAPFDGAASAVGLTPQISALEKEVFGKTYAKDAMLARIDRLEATIFPQDVKGAKGSPADRVARMIAVIPIGAPPNVAQQQQQYQQQVQQQQQQQMDPNYDPYNDPNMTANNQRRGGGGLGKIINSLGSFINGGMSMGNMGGMGAYPMTSGGMYTDPATGFLVDRLSGNLINPSTGQIMGRRSVGGYTTNPGYGFNGFNNGFSNPYSSPYSNPMYGIGGSTMGGTGIRFGTGGVGGGFGSGMGGLGTWP